MNISRTMVLLLALVTSVPSWTWASNHERAALMSEGEIRKIDKDTGKLTIKHGEIKNLGMPPMTMAFRVKEASMLEKVKAGDAVRFNVEKIGGQYTVTALELK